MTHQVTNNQDAIMLMLVLVILCICFYWAIHSSAVKPGMDLLRKNSSDHRECSLKNSLKGLGRSADDDVTNVNDGYLQESQIQRPRRISNMSESSENGRPKKQQRSPLQMSALPPAPAPSALLRQLSSMSTSDDRPACTKAQSTGRLLEEWPRRGSCSAEDMSLSSSVKEVKFSVYSRVHVYPTHECERKKSYKSNEIKRFKSQVGLDVLRVEELISTCSHKRGNAICHLIDVGELTPEELVGIDHLLCGEDAARKIAFDRFAHAKLVVRKQRELYELDLAAVASKKSFKNVDKALMRAKLAELRGKDDVAQDDDNLKSIDGMRRITRSPPAA